MGFPARVTPSILSVQCGRVAPLGPRGVPSGFVKAVVRGPVAIGLRGLAGDEQADLRVHGDADKTVYAYPSESYAVWRGAYPRHEALWRPGGVGENLTTLGLSEQAVCIGDVHQVGSAVLQVTQPREPCFKLALRFADSSLPKAMLLNGLSGWYYRVRAAGVVRAGDPVVVLEQARPEWTIARMNLFIRAKPRDAAAAACLAGVTGLARTWQRRLAR